MSIRLIYFLFLSYGTFFTALANQRMLTYRPVAAEYSYTMDRIIFISGNPNTLHIYDPASQKDVAVQLVQPPLSLSLSPDGIHAAVGHDALVSYISLTTAAVEKTFVIPATADHVVAAASWIYVFPTSQGNSQSLNIATGTATPNPSVFFTNGSGERLNTTVNAIYGTRDGTSPNDVEEYNISTGPITQQFDSPYHGDFCIFGPVWFSPDGSRIYTGCGTIFRASKDSKLDMYYLSTLQGVSSISAFTESAALKRFALVQAGPVYPPPPAPISDATVFLFDSVYLQPIGQLNLSSFAVNGSTYSAHCKWVFFNAASTKLYAISEADPASGLLNDFGSEIIPLGATASCGAKFASSSADVPASGSLGSIGIVADPSCIYQAKTSADWLQIVSGGYGSGNGALTYHAAVNADTAPRSADIIVGNQSYNVRQDGAVPHTALTLLGYNVVDAANDKPQGKVILASSGPNELHIVDPGTGSSKDIPLVMPPLCISVRPDGLFAAVGHDGWVSYVNLQTATVEKVIQVITDVHHVILASNGYMYLFPQRSWSDIYSLEIVSGILTATSAIYDGRVPRLYADGKSLYVGGDAFSKWDISGGVAKLANQNFGANTCGNLWLSEDGQRLFAACGKVYTTSEIPAQDLQYNGTLSAAIAAVWIDESLHVHRTAVIPSAGGFNPNPGVLSAGDTEVQIYSDDFLGYQGAIPLPQVTVGGTPFPGHGLFVFWNATSTALIVVMQADTAAQLLSGSAIAQIPPSAVLNPQVSAVVNDASQSNSRIAPGEIIAIYGTGLGGAHPTGFTLDPITNKVSGTLAGTQVLFNGLAAPVLYSSSTQVNAIVPFEVYSGQVSVQVAYQTVPSPGINITVTNAVPAIFTVNGSGSGQAIAVNQDGSICDSAHPAKPGSIITLYFTGGGLTNPFGVTGALAGSTLEYLQLTAAVTVGNVPAQVTFAGSAPLLVEGVGQLNIRLAENTPSGAQPVILTVGIDSSPNTATIVVRR